MTKINLMINRLPQAKPMPKVSLLSQLRAFKLNSLWMWIVAFASFLLVGAIANADRLERPLSNARALCQANIGIDDCDTTINKKVKDSRYRYTCISDCGNQRVLYVENRRDSGPAGGQVGVGRVVVVDKCRPITSDYVKKEIFPGNFLGYKKYSETAAQMECRVGPARGLNRYGDRIHSSLKRGLTCKNGKVQVRDNQWDPSDADSFNLAGDRQKAKIEQSCIRREGGDEQEVEIKISRKAKRDGKTEYSNFMSGFGDGHAMCDSMDQDLAVKVAQSVFRADARSCNFNSSSLSRNSDPEGVYVGVGPNPFARRESESQRVLGPVPLNTPRSNIGSERYDLPDYTSVFGE